MGALIPVSNHLTAALVASVETNIAAGKILSDPLIISMTASATKSLIKVGPKRTAESEAIFTKLLKPYSTTIPTEYSLGDFEAIRSEIHNINIIKGLLNNQLEVYDTFGNVLEHNFLMMCKQGLDIAKVLMKNSTGITTAVDEVTTEFYPHSANTATTYSIAAASKMEIVNIESGKRFINDGNTILTVLLSGGNAATTITVYPSDSTIVPKGWVNIVVNNLSTTSAGSFRVYIK